LLELSDEIFHDITASRTLVVPSAQRAASIRLAFAARMLACGERAWRAPDVRSESEWLDRELLRTSDSEEHMPRPLRAAEEWCVWREACDAALSETDASLVDTLADALRRSARLLFDWCVPIEVLRGAGSESELLARTLAGVEARCAGLRAAGRHELYGLLRRRLLRQRALSGSLTFAGFTEQTPARGALVQACSLQGVATREHVSYAAPGNARHIVTADADTELELAAKWCRDRIARDGSRRFLVIIPDLARRREAARRAFRHALAPSSVLASQEDDSAVVLEGGEPLSTYPLVHQALSALEFLCGHLDFTVFSAWLRSAFWSGPPPPERAGLDVWLRGRLGIQVTPADLLAALPAAPPPLREAADSLAATLAAAVRALTPAQLPAGTQLWSRRFQAALTAMGWPGGRALSSAEEQTRVRLLEVLDDGATLAPRLGPLTASRALAVMRALSERTMFAPATGDAAVTLSSALVDPVVRYDGIWVAGLHADAWPQPPRLDPFIPAAAQRRAGIVATSAGLLLEQARMLLECWRRAAPEVVLSAARHIEDRGQLVSPLLLELPEGAVEIPRDALVQRVRAARRVERYHDRSGVPWAGHALPSGTRVIEQQSRCAFRAYAELRLGSAVLETPRPGIDPRTRGHLIHRALELLWQGLGGADGLAAARGAGRLDRLIEEATSRALQERIRTGTLTADHPAMVRELRRTVRLVSRLCELELTRAPFRVHALEARRTLTLGGVELAVRIDRIDELHDGTYAIFDYKSGRPAQLGWLDARLAQPQLLVYLLASGLNVSTLAAVHITSQQGGFRGLADRAGRLPRVQGIDTVPMASAAANLFETAWEVQTRTWRGHIEQLVSEFIAGHAAADPIAQACQTCHLHAFCRIAEHTQSVLDPTDPAAESPDD
jgi:ATP-dependent helicase/nuclease subunit B